MVTIIAIGACIINHKVWTFAAHRARETRELCGQRLVVYRLVVTVVTIVAFRRKSVLRAILKV